ncbi:ABC transporter permease subunit [Natrialba swarupiae]|nr:ABC transporter permease subunit [Natrialba swarupiae]
MSLTGLSSLPYSKQIRLGRATLLVAILATLEPAGRAEWFDQLTYVPLSTMVETAYGLRIGRTHGRYHYDDRSRVRLVCVGDTGRVGHRLVPVATRQGQAGVGPVLDCTVRHANIRLLPDVHHRFRAERVPIVLIAFAMSVTIIIISTANGLAKVPDVLIDVGRSMGLSRREQFRHVIFPAAVPYIFTGLKLGFVYAFIGVIASEFILSNSGLGYQISWYYQQFQTADMYAVLLIVITQQSL